MDIMEALWKPPENNEKDGGSNSEDKQLTSLEQAEMDANQRKARYPAYEVFGACCNFVKHCGALSSVVKKI